MVLPVAPPGVKTQPLRGEIGGLCDPDRPRRFLAGSQNWGAGASGPRPCVRFVRSIRRERPLGRAHPAFSRMSGLSGWWLSRVDGVRGGRGRDRRTGRRHYESPAALHAADGACQSSDGQASQSVLVALLPAPPRPTGGKAASKRVRAGSEARRASRSRAGRRYPCAVVIEAGDSTLSRTNSTRDPCDRSSMADRRAPPWNRRPTWTATTRTPRSALLMA
jgi:hypothetical protein